jgi:hypothetical protein
MKLLIGKGTIGTSLANNINFDYSCDSSNIHEVFGKTFEMVVCAAPSSNRIIANNNLYIDEKLIDKLIEDIDKIQATRFVLISTVDVVSYPESIYGKNRLKLENHIKKQFKEYHILRLSTLVGENIKKNVLYDLVNKQYLNDTNPLSFLQWYPLSNLCFDINNAVNNSIKEINLVSDPISTGEIAEVFFPSLKITSNNEPRKYNLTPYIYSKQEIFNEIKKCLHLWG